MNENVEFRQVVGGRWIWTGCRHPGGFPTEEAARAAHALYPEYYDVNTQLRRRRELKRMIGELAWGKQ